MLTLTVTATSSSVYYDSCTTVTASGVGGSSPYTYLWSTGVSSQNINACPLSTTTYTVKVTDAVGKTATSTAMDFGKRHMRTNDQMDTINVIKIKFAKGIIR